MTDDIESISGVGPEIADNLRAAGFESAAEVRNADVDELAAVELIGTTSAQAIVNNEADGHRGPDPTVEEHIDAVRPQLEKPISDRAAIAQSPIGRSTHKEWLKKDGEPYERYQEMYHEARAVAEEKLVQRGLTNEFDSSLVKFLLKATMDYEDKQTHEVDADVDKRIEGEGFTVQFDE
jgi:hypothetical protein